jgi:hypothetical protein
VVAVERAWTCSPIRRHGTEYNAGPTLTWMSGPTLPVDQVANVNTLRGNGFNAGASNAANTAAGAAPSRPGCARYPATSRHHTSAPSRMCSNDSKSRPRQNESRTYGIARSTRGLSLGLNARAGSINVA